MTADPGNRVLRAKDRIRLPALRWWQWRRFTSALAGLSILVAACSAGATGSTTTTVTTPATSPSTAVVCDAPTPLFPVAAVRDGPAGSCREWIDKSHGRAVNATTGSATIWSRRTEYGTALVVGAVHTLGLGWFGEADSPVTESMVNPGDLVGVARLFLIRPAGNKKPRQAGHEANPLNNLIHCLLVSRFPERSHFALGLLTDLSPSVFQELRLDSPL